MRLMLDWRLKMEGSINSHYIPQLLLRHFCKEGKLNYHNIHTNKTEERSTKSVFSKTDYYPAQLEKDLSSKIEAQFANVLNKKILNGKNRISLTADDLLIIKKYQIITMIRVKDDNLEHNAWYRALKKNGCILQEDPFKDFFKGDFFDNLNKVLSCKSQEELVKIITHPENLNLYTFVKNAVYSYMVFVKTNNCKEDFIIPDRGWAEYCGPLSIKKINAMLDMLEKAYDPYIAILVQMSTPQDYAVFPLSNDMALLAVSPAFKALRTGTRYNVIYPPDQPTLSSCLGFGTSKTFAPPDNRFHKNGTKEYIYNIHQISKYDVKFINSLFLNNCEEYYGYADYNKIRFSVED